MTVPTKRSQSTGLLATAICSLWLRLLLVSGLLLLASLLLATGDRDLSIVRHIHDQSGHWPGMQQDFWLNLYTWAPWPGLLLGGYALIRLLFAIRRRKGWRQPLFYIVLLLTGPGLLVNVLGKDHLGRPRPRELREFGGAYQFSQFWQKSDAGKNSSFPCGHASIAFYLMAPWFVYRRRRPRLAMFYLGGGLCFGLLTGTGRIMQGAHFATDVLWSGGIIYISGELLHWALLARDEQEHPDFFPCNQRFDDAKFMENK